MPHKGTLLGQKQPQQDLESHVRGWYCGSPTLWQWGEVAPQPTELAETVTPLQLVSGCKLSPSHGHLLKQGHQGVPENLSGADSLLPATGGMWQCL